MKALTCLQWLTGSVPKLNTAGYVTITYPTAWQYIYGDSISPTWESFPGATLYRIQLCLWGSGTLVEEKTVSFENLTVTFNSITDEKYEIKVRAEKGSRVTGYRGVYFEIENISAPTYADPLEAAEVPAIGGLPYLVSVAISGQVGSFLQYRQHCATDAAFTNIVDNSLFNYPNPFDVSLSSYGWYYLRSRVEEGGVTGQWSTTRSFRLISE